MLYISSCRRPLSNTFCQCPFCPKSYIHSRDYLGLLFQTNIHLLAPTTITSTFCFLRQNFFKPAKQSSFFSALYFRSAFHRHATHGSTNTAESERVQLLLLLLAFALALFWPWISALLMALACMRVHSEGIEHSTSRCTDQLRVI